VFPSAPLLIVLPNRQPCAPAQRVIFQHPAHSPQQGFSIAAV